MSADIEIYRGEDATLAFTLSPVEDISEWDISFYVAYHGGILLEKEAEIVNGPEGEFSVALESADTVNADPGFYPYVAWRTDDGSERVVASGRFFVNWVARGVAQ